MARTMEAIAARLSEMSDKFLSFQPEVLIGYLDLQHARPFLRSDFDVSTFTFTDPADSGAIKAHMAEYMEDYGWPKARGHRGISAGRTVEKMQAWLWLLEDDEMLAIAEDESQYPQYGVPILKQICEKYGFPIPEGDDVARMSEGLPCEPGCDMGCGR